jgi:hypothetical protein
VSDDPIKPARLGRVVEFVDARTGDMRALKDPDGPATPNQLRKLNALGLLAAVEADHGQPLTKAEAAWLIDDALHGDDPPLPDW